MAAISPAAARQLCTAAEYKLVAESSPARLKSLSEKALRAKVQRARTLRDKWTDVGTRQRRAAQRQRASRDTNAAQRSQKKASLFAEVLARLETQLKKVTQLAEPDKGRTSLRRTPSKAKRTATQRQQRSDLRTKLAKQQRELKPAAAKATAAKSSTQKSASTPTAARTERSASQKSLARKAKKPSSPPTPTTGLVEFNREQQREARTAATQARLKKSVISPRIQGHVSARGRRAQGRRDSRG
jgi:hypothetical protein